MTIKIGINGFGRIGRMALRAAFQDFENIDVVAINGHGGNFSLISPVLRPSRKTKKVFKSIDVSAAL